MEAPPSPLSSRPELQRSVVERSAVQRSFPGKVFRQSEADLRVKFARSSWGLNTGLRYCLRFPGRYYLAFSKALSRPDRMQILPTSYSNPPHLQTSACRSGSAFDARSGCLQKRLGLTQSEQKSLSRLR